MGFYAGNGGEFVNMKIDEFRARLRVTIRYSPSYSPWSHNHKKLMKENKVMLNDSLVKAASN